MSSRPSPGLVERAPHAATATVQDMGVDHGGADVLVSEELLDGADVVAVLEEMGGEGVAEGVAGDALGEGGVAVGLGDGALDDGLVEVVAGKMYCQSQEVEASGYLRARASGSQTLP